jgi:hypothetical protein
MKKSMLKILTLCFISFGNVSAQAIRASYYGQEKTTYGTFTDDYYLLAKGLDNIYIIDSTGAETYIDVDSTNYKEFRTIRRDTFTNYFIDHYVLTTNDWSYVSIDDKKNRIHSSFSKKSDHSEYEIYRKPDLYTVSDIGQFSIKVLNEHEFRTIDDDLIVDIFYEITRIRPKFEDERVEECFPKVLFSKERVQYLKNVRLPFLYFYNIKTPDTGNLILTKETVKPEHIGKSWYDKKLRNYAYLNEAETEKLRELIRKLLELQK